MKQGLPTKGTEMVTWNRSLKTRQPHLLGCKFPCLRIDYTKLPDKFFRVLHYLDKSSKIHGNLLRNVGWSTEDGKCHFIIFRWTVTEGNVAVCFSRPFA